jgi:hypothetical protein
MDHTQASQRWTWLGVLLLVAGFLGHFFAARAIGGSYIAYRDHIFGFFFILLVTGAIIAGVGWKFWPRRRDITLAIVGLVQALLGMWVYIGRFNVHG